MPKGKTMALLGHWRRWWVAGAALALFGAAVAGLGFAQGSSAPPGALSGAPVPLPARIGAPAPGGTAGGISSAVTGAVAAGAGGGSVASGPALPVPAPGPDTGQVSTLVAPKVVENATVDLTVGHGALGRIVDQLTSLAGADGGIVSRADQSTGSDGLGNASLTLRVPEAEFASALTQIKAAGKVTGVQSSGADVTSQYVDLQSRIQALQASRDQYLQILAKASAIGDVLAVQNQLDGVQSQLEQLQGQLNVLNDQTTYSTIQVAMVEAPVPGRTQPQPGPQSGLAQAWHRAAAAFTGGFDWLVGASGAIAFALVLGVAIGVIGRLGWGLTTRRRHRLASAPVSA